MLADIAVTWDPAKARGDWSVANGDLALGNALLSAVMVSLFTDRVAPVQPTSADQAASIGQAGSSIGGRRGWWGDAYTGRPIGSSLWQLRRAIKTGRRALLQDAEDMCTEALQWLLDDGVAASVIPIATWATPTALQLAITILEPGAAAAQTFTFQSAWEDL